MALVAASGDPPPGLQEATKNSTVEWQENLTSLFHHAKDRFPDVVWALVGDEEDHDKVSEEVWGHKAIVYARAPPSFQNRYFAVRPNGGTSPLPYSSDAHYPTESAFSLDQTLATIPRTPSPFRAPSPVGTDAHVEPISLLRLSTSINPALFSDELEYLYTGKNFGEAFEFLFDSSESSHRGDEDQESARIDKLRKDLVFMWRSRLYSDVRIALTGNFGGTHESTTAIFSSHRFILVSRSSYFHTALISWPSSKTAPGEPPTLTLPSPPFTPASLHFTLGFIYTGTLIFSHRSYDLSTAFAILRAAMYLALPTLHDEVQARIAQEMLHGLFHAIIPFAEYERLTGGRWGTGGCRCRQCARRVPRVLEFAIADDVKNDTLEHGARRALVGLFGEGWCTQEFAGLAQKIRDSVLKGVAKRTTPLNAFPLLFAAEHALLKLGNSIEPWADTVREMVFAGRKGVDELLCRDSEACFSSDEWMEIMESDGVRFEDGERVEWAMAAVLRGVKEPSAPALYQTLVSSILLRPHPTEVNAPMLPATSHIRVQVEQARLELLKWIGKRWLVVRQERGFDPLEGWALKEISDHIEVPVDDLLSPPSYSSPKKRQTGLLRPISNHPHTSKADAESETASSMRVSVLSRSVPVVRSGASMATTARDRPGVGSSASSVRSVARSTHSVASTASASTIPAGVGAARNGGRGNGNGAAVQGGTAAMSPARRIASDVRAGRQVELKDRPDSKLTPSVREASRSPSPSLQPSIIEPQHEEDGDEEGAETPEASENDDEEQQQEQQLQADDASTEGGRESIYQTPPPPMKKTLITRASLASVSSRTSTRTGTASIHSRTRTASSTAESVRSLSTARKSTTSTYSLARTSPSSNVRPNSRTSVTSTARSRLNVNNKSSASTTITSPSHASRPISRVSTATDTSNAASFRTATGGLSTPTTVRSRRTSTTSSASARTAGGRSSTNSPVNERARRISGASLSSVASNAASVRSAMTRGATPAKRGAPPIPVVDASKLSPAAAAAKKPVRATPVKLAVSTSSRALTPKKIVSIASGSGTKKVVLSKKSGESLRSLASAAAKVVESSTPPLPQHVKPAEDVPSVPPVAETVEADVEMESEKENQTPPPAPLAAEAPPPLNSSSILPFRITREILAEASSSEHKKSSSSASSSSVATLRRKGSTDTIKTVKSSGLSTANSDGSAKPPATQAQAPRYPLQPQQPALSSKPPLSTQAISINSILANDVPRGSTLEIGIPCIIASKRKRFKAYARYIGEVAGETGPWVGVEVPMPMGDSWGDDRVAAAADDRQWNDGSWGGIRYFEMGGGGSEWEYGDERGGARRRRMDMTSSGGGGGFWEREKGGLKREGDQLSIASDRMKRMRSVSPAVSDMSGTESRGLFVRPQQVLYVVDAVGSDL